MEATLGCTTRHQLVLGDLASLGGSNRGNIEHLTLVLFEADLHIMLAEALVDHLYVSPEVQLLPLLFKLREVALLRSLVRVRHI